jgi:hypothetical protein
MIKIRYRDLSELSPGLHAAAERHGRITVIYLLSGLTAAQRRAALRRLRLSARVGRCPPLPVVQLGLALAVDAVLTAIWRAGAVFRLHPAGSTVPVMMASGAAIAFLVLSSMSSEVLSGPLLPGEPPAWGDVPHSGPPRAGQAAAPSPAPNPGQRAGQTGQVITDRSGPSASTPPPVPSGPGTGTGGTGTGGTGTGSTGPPGGTATGTPTPGTPGGSPAVRPSPPSTPTPVGLVPATPTAGLCLDVGPLGICLNLGAGGG